MSDSFSVRCQQCGEQADFQVHEIPELKSYVDNKTSDAYSEGRDDGIEEGTRDALSDLVGGQRPLMELSVAIRRGDRAEAERWLDIIAAEAGARAVEDVEQGRFSLRAKVPA